MQNIRRDFFMQFFCRSTWDNNMVCHSIMNTLSLDAKTIYDLQREVSKQAQHREINRTTRRS